MADTKFEEILEMSFMKISNMDVVFSKKTLIWKFYTIIQIWVTAWQVEIIDLRNWL